MAIDEEALEQLLKATIDTAVQTQAIKLQDLERVIVDSTVQEKPIPPHRQPPLEIARHKVGSAAKRLVLQLKQTFAAEGKQLRCPRRSTFDPPCRLNFDPGLVAGIARSRLRTTVAACSFWFVFACPSRGGKPRRVITPHTPPRCR